MVRKSSSRFPRIPASLRAERSVRSRQVTFEVSLRAERSNLGLLPACPAEIASARDAHLAMTPDYLVEI
jgi:hypothetical protein